jgi:RNA recognition motif-containing protein
MLLFIGRLPPNFRRQQLYNFVKRGIRNKGLLGLLQKTAKFDCKIMMMRDKDTQELEYFAVVSGLSSETARKAIKNLNHVQFNGKVVGVRVYRVRSWTNDRRRLRLHTKPDPTKEQRLRDRRGRWTVTEIWQTTAHCRSRESSVSDRDFVATSR